MIYKEIPKSEEAEQELLGQVLSNPECLEEIKDLIPSEQVFYSDMHQILWRIISDM